MSVSLSSMPNGGSPVRLPNIGLRGGQATRPQSVKRAIPRSTTKIPSIEQIRPSSRLPSSLPPERQPARDCGPTNGHSWVPNWTACRAE